MTNERPRHSTPGIRVQQGSEARAGCGVHVQDDGSHAAALFVRAGDDEVLEALSRAFTLHRAPSVRLAEGAPESDETVGDCVIRDDGITMTLGAVDPAAWNRGRGMLGLNLTLTWGRTPQVWRDVAEETGCVLACLVTEEQYQAAVTMVGGARLVDVSVIPAAPVLKLETVIH